MVYSGINKVLHFQGQIPLHKTKSKLMIFIFQFPREAPRVEYKLQDFQEIAIPAAFWLHSIWISGQAITVSLSPSLIG